MTPGSVGVVYKLQSHFVLLEDIVDFLWHLVNEIIGVKSKSTKSLICDINH